MVNIFTVNCQETSTTSSWDSFTVPTKNWQAYVPKSKRRSHIKEFCGNLLFRHLASSKYSQALFTVWDSEIDRLTRLIKLASTGVCAACFAHSLAIQVQSHLQQMTSVTFLMKPFGETFNVFLYWHYQRLPDIRRSISLSQAVDELHGTSEHGWPLRKYTPNSQQATHSGRSSYPYQQRKFSPTMR